MIDGWSEGFGGKCIFRMKFWGGLDGMEQGQENKSSGLNSVASSLVFADEGTLFP